jgi:hypothetical protein
VHDHDVSAPVRPGFPTSPVPRATAAGLLVVAAALAFGGSFGTLYRQRSEYGIDDAATGWRVFLDVPHDVPADTLGHPPRFGIAVTVAAALALAAAVALVLSLRPVGAAPLPRVAAVGAVGPLCGAV